MAKSKEIADAMWAGDTDKLSDLAPCVCCCDEHYSLTCPALVWNGCIADRGTEEDAYKRAFPDLPWDD